MLKSLTFNFEVHAPKHQRADELSLHLPLKVDEDGGKVAVGVVGDAGGGDGLEELGLGEFSGQCAQVLVDEGAKRDAGMTDEKDTFLLLQHFG